MSVKEGVFKMSQEKVDRYKKEKANRKKIMKRQKLFGYLRKTAAVLILCGIVAWGGFSAYHSYEAGQPREVLQIDYDALDSYLTGLEK